MTEHESFLEAIVREPDDDTRRLAYADWLDEHDGPFPCDYCHGTDQCPTADGGLDPHWHCPRCNGRRNGCADRAEFIRVQCALSQMHLPVVCVESTNLVSFKPDYPFQEFERLAKRENALLARHRADWLRVSCAACSGTGRVGEHYDPASDTMRGGRSCDRCAGTGDMGGLTWKFDPPSGIEALPPRLPPVVEFRRGFPAVVTVPRLRDAVEPFALIWRPTPWLLAVVAHHPVTEVAPLDRVPYDGGTDQYGRRRFWWPDPAVHGDTRPATVLPTEIRPAGEFPNADAARSALGRAIVALARGGV